MLAMVMGTDYLTTESTLHNSNLNMRILANRYDLPIRPGLIAQTPHAGELVEHGTSVGATISSEHPERRRQSVELRQ